MSSPGAANWREPSVLDRMLESGVVAVVRLRGPSRIRDTVAALAAGGVGAVEIALTTPGAVDSIRDGDQRVLQHRGFARGKTRAVQFRRKTTARGGDAGDR